MAKPAFSTTAEIYMQAHEQTAVNSRKIWEGFVDDVLFKIIYINNFHQNIKFAMEEESIGELTSLDTLLKRNNTKIFVLL